MEETYKRIEELCKERDINITQLSKRTGIPRSVFSELKAGRTKQLSSKYLSVIADFLGASTDYLLGNVSEPFQTSVCLKEVNKMCDRERQELLDKQLQLLAEKSQESDTNTLVRLTLAMCELYRTITP